MTRGAAFADWSPSQLAYALGWRIDLRTRGNGQTVPALVAPCGKRLERSHAASCRLLSRLADARGLNPAAPPMETPRATLDGLDRNLPPYQHGGQS